MAVGLPLLCVCLSGRCCSAQIAVQCEHASEAVSSEGAFLCATRNECYRVCKNGNENACFSLWGYQGVYSIRSPATCLDFTHAKKRLDVLGRCSEELLNISVVFVIFKNIVFRVALKSCFYRSKYYSYFYSRSWTISLLMFLEKF